MLTLAFVQKKFLGLILTQEGFVNLAPVTENKKSGGVGI